MLFGLFGKKKAEAEKEYAEKLTGATLEGTLDGDMMEELIDFASAKDLSNKELARAQSMACEAVFEKLYHDGYLTDDDYDEYAHMIDMCYMLKDDVKYRYTTIAKRSNAIYKIQEEGLLPTISKEYANVKYRSGEDLHFSAPAKLMEPTGTDYHNQNAVAVGRGTTFKAGHLPAGENKNWKENGGGAFWITTFRIGFRGKKGMFTVELDALDHVELGGGPLLVFEKGQDKPYAVKLDDYDMAGVVLERLLHGGK